MILCCGEALIDMIPAATQNGRDGFVPHSGGSVFNTAIALGRLGISVGMLSGVSSDLFGQQLEADLTSSGVDTAHLIKSTRPTTLAFVELEDGQASYSFFDQNSAGRMIGVGDFPVLSTDVSALFFGGISLACEPAADAYAAFVERECAGRVIMVDPNIRPTFIENETRYRERLERMLTVADIVKVSDEDLNWIIPGDERLEDKAANLCSRYACVLIVTLGPDGATACLPGGEVVKVSGQSVLVRDTVGAGDTFNAGILASLERRMCLTKPGVAEMTGTILKQSLEFSVQVASVTVSRVGADPPWRREIPA